MFDHWMHEVVKTNKGTIILLDVAYTFDCGWEGAYAIFDEETFRSNWDEDDYTFDDICEYGEYLDAFEGWTVVSNFHRKPEAAEKKLRKYVAAL